MFRDFFIDAWSYIRPRTPDERARLLEQAKITAELVEVSGHTLMEPHARFLASQVVAVDDPEERRAFRKHTIENWRKA